MKILCGMNLLLWSMVICYYVEKNIWTLHSETYKGQRNGKTSLKSENTSLLRTKSFAQDTADKLGIVKWTVEWQIQAAKNLTPKARAILLHSDISKENLLKISRLEPKLQSEAAKLLSVEKMSRCWSKRYFYIRISVYKFTLYTSKTFNIFGKCWNRAYFMKAMSR